MRQIKFRGKRIDNGEWVCGYLIEDCYIVGKVIDWEEDYFTTESWAKVDPDTVGQFTRLGDKNKVEIYHGDLIKVTGEYKPGIYEVIWDDFRCAWWGKNTKRREKEYDDDFYQLLNDPWQWEYREIIGNRWDNPELMEV